MWFCVPPVGPRTAALKTLQTSTLQPHSVETYCVLQTPPQNKPSIALELWWKLIMMISFGCLRIHFMDYTCVCLSNHPPADILIFLCVFIIWGAG